MDWKFLKRVHKKSLETLLDKLPEYYTNDHNVGKLAYSITDYIYCELNSHYDFPSRFEEDYLDYFIDITVHQCNPMIHPLTCGVNSEHALLLPRMSFTGESQLICPTCGYVQCHIPSCVISNPQDIDEVL